MSNEIQPINKKRINGADWVLIMVDDEGCTGGECPNCEMWNHHIYNQCALPIDLTCSKYAEYFARWYREDSHALDFFRKPKPKEDEKELKRKKEAREFQNVVMPVMNWLKANHSPHHKIIIDSESAELVSGEISHVRPQ